MDAVRIQADALELVVADQLWPITKYRELLYIK
jgi:glutamine synthetase type III